MGEPVHAWADTPVLAGIHRAMEHGLRQQGVSVHRDEVGGHRAFWYDAPPRRLPETERAAAPVTVLLHGLGDSSDTYAGLIASLARRGRRVLALDLLAHGRTEAPAAGFATIDVQAAFVRAFLDQVLRGQQVTLVGQSMGGWVAARVAGTSSAVAKLVLVASPGIEYDEMWERAKLLDIADARDVDLLWRMSCFRVPLVLRVAQHEVARLFRAPPVRGFLEHPSAEGFLSETEIRDIRIPTEILWGDQDGLAPPAIGSLLHKWIPDSRLTIIRRCGHAIQYERPRAFLRFLDGVLPRLGPRRIGLDRIRRLTTGRVGLGGQESRD